VRHRIRQIPPNLIFLASAAVYLWLAVNARLIYQSFGTLLPDAPVFVTGWAFLKNALGAPGGLAMYLTGFLSQGYYHSWLGAAIIVLCALVLCELSRHHLLAADSARAAGVLSSLPAIAIILICGRYKHALPACLVVSLGLLCSLIFRKLSLRRSAIRALAYCGMTALVFWWAGAGGVLVFALVTVIGEGFIRKDWKLAVLAVPVSIAIILGAARYLFLIPSQQALLTLTPVSETITGGMKTFSLVLTFILYGFVPLSVLLLFLSKVAFSRGTPGPKKRPKPTKQQQKKKKKGYRAVAKRRLSLPLIGSAVATVLPIAVTAAGLYFSHDPIGRAFVLTHDYSVEGRWDEILQFNRRLPKGASHPYLNHDVIRALYHTNRLPHDMFQFPMLSHGLFLTHEKRVSYLAQLKLCDMFLELGQVNAAEKLASEILVGKNSPMAIEKLAWINIIKGQGQTARIYLNALKKDLVHRKTAETLLDALDNGFTSEQSGYIDRIRSCMFQEGDPGTGSDPIEKVLTRLLERNPRNRMAFEYLMACYLLAGQVDKVAANTKRLNELGYPSLPIPYEEAVLIHLSRQGYGGDLRAFGIRRETVERYAKFVRLKKALQVQNRRELLGQLIVEFGTSYFFFFTFGCVGMA